MNEYRTQQDTFIALIVMTNQVVRWAVRRYVRYVIVGVASTFLVFNLALQMDAGLILHCSDECIYITIDNRVSPYDTDVLNYVRAHWLDPPAPRGSYKAANGLDLVNPPWASFNKWGEAHEFLITYFKKYQPHGTFVEVGAQDGEFMSFTLYLEQELGFEGLLVEPNPEHYSILRQMGRSSYSINACATPGIKNMKDVLWIRDTPKDLPPVLRRIQEGSNRLLQYVSPEDRELGTTQSVQCIYLPTMVQAALHSRMTDLLVISTHGGELGIVGALEKNFMFRVLVIVTPMAMQEDTEIMENISKRRNLTLAYSANNIHVYLPSAHVKVVTI
ncbi:uncharacterized protein LOC143035051 [Oratosquilla oratoria]|uniref:uncharacterized protein LOC143035051 n=1 Tax=Oratosquilla oratoria TaxID=337810 RepID=UPI003F767A4B